MKSLKVNQIEKNQMSANEMNYILGGGGTNYCGCACAYADSGGSSTYNNGYANSRGGVNSPEQSKWKAIVMTTVYE